LLDLIRNAVNPKNMFFQYEHFTTNCATIPRDLLDQALGGYLKQQLNSQPSKRNYRYYVREHMAYYPPLGFLLDVLMNSKLDQPMTKWHETFYPAKLSEYLSELPHIDDNQKQTQHSLLGPKTSWVTSSSTHHSKSGLFPLIFCLLSLSVLLMLMIATQAKKYHLTVVRIIARAYCVYWGLLSATLGLVMLISWLFSSHLDMHHNQNLLIFFVTDIIFAFFRVTVRNKHKEPLKNAWRNLPVLYMLIHIIALIVYLLLSVTGVSEQNITSTLYYLIPLQIGFFVWQWQLRSQAYIIER
ncbi:MAG: hypothetical protein OXC40_04175, partial [Proteobacteria bacterium]|nr:hypothetical protein [Pseudomonadota bacterium]